MRSKLVSVRDTRISRVTYREGKRFLGAGGAKLQLCFVSTRVSAHSSPWDSDPIWPRQSGTNQKCVVLLFYESCVSVLPLFFTPPLLLLHIPIGS